MGVKMTAHDIDAGMAIRLQKLNLAGQEFYDGLRGLLVGESYPVRFLFALNAADTTLHGYKRDLAAYNPDGAAVKLYDLHKSFFTTCVETCAEEHKHSISAMEQNGIDPSGFAAASFVLPTDRLEEYARFQAATQFAGSLLNASADISDTHLFNILTGGTDPRASETIVRMGSRAGQDAPPPVVEFGRYVLELFAQDTGQVVQSFLARGKLQSTVDQRNAWRYLAGRTPEKTGPYRASETYIDRATKAGFAL